MAILNKSGNKQINVNPQEIKEVSNWMQSQGIDMNNFMSEFNMTIKNGNIMPLNEDRRQDFNVGMNHLNKIRNVVNGSDAITADYINTLSNIKGITQTGDGTYRQNSEAMPMQNMAQNTTTQTTQTTQQETPQPQKSIISKSARGDKSVMDEQRYYNQLIRQGKVKGNLLREDGILGDKTLAMRDVVNQYSINENKDRTIPQKKNMQIGKNAKPTQNNNYNSYMTNMMR